MKKYLLLILSSIMVVLLTLATISCSKIINPNIFSVNYIDFTDEQLPSNFDDFSLAFFSDLEYGTFLKEERLNKFLDEINSVSANVVIFGGDLFDTGYLITENDITLLTTKLKSINAEYGKFAILGDFDLEEEHYEIVKEILYNADFELLQDNSIQLHNGSTNFINLYGFDYTDENIDVSSVYTHNDENTFTITIIHGAKLADSLPNGYSNLTISGHSHHAQINLIKPYKEYAMTSSYTTGLQNSSNTKLYVSTGVGTTNTDARLFSKAEILFFRFKVN